MTRDHVFPPTFHAAPDGDPFASALCGHRPEGVESVWVTAIRSDVNCHLCLKQIEARP